MGGSFNPLHLGHINSLLTVKEIFQLDRVLVVPAFQPPLSPVLTGATALQRLEMLHQTFAWSSVIEVDEQEIKRKRTSYSYLTVENIAARAGFGELFFIMGLDQFSGFDLWKNGARILRSANLIVTSRPPNQFPKKSNELPLVIQPIFKSLSSKQVLLKKPFRSIYFCSLTDRDISSSFVKEQLKNHQAITHLVPPAVDHYIKSHRLYGIHPRFCFPGRKTFRHFCETELESKKAFEVQYFDLTARALPFSNGLIASSSNTKHTKALSRHLRKRIYETFNVQPLAVEGEKEGRWIVLDYNEWVIHIFYDYVRRFYGLEEIWKNS